MPSWEEGWKSALIHLQTVLSGGRENVCGDLGHLPFHSFKFQLPTQRLVIGTLSLNKLGKGSF